MTTVHLTINQLRVAMNSKLPLYWTKRAMQVLTFDGRKPQPEDIIEILEIKHHPTSQIYHTVNLLISYRTTYGLPVGLQKCLVISHSGETPGGAPVFQLFPCSENTGVQQERSSRPGYCNCSGPAKPSFIGLVGGGYWIDVCASCHNEKD